MEMTRGTSEVQEYLQLMAHQWLGLPQPVGGLQEMGQIVEADGNVWVVDTEIFFVDGQGAAHQGLSLGEAISVM
jgi:hypothetical protein